MTIKLGDPAVAIGTAETDEQGDFWFDSPENIQPGDRVQVECGDILKTHVVTELTVTAVDPDNNTVSGTASPETWVSVGIHGIHVNRHVQADEHGDWIADFSEAVGSEPWDAAYDLTAGDDVYAQQLDEDGDATSVHWRQPHFNVTPQHDFLGGHHWPANDTVTIKLGEPAVEIGTAETDELGDFWFDSPENIQPGDQVQVECGDILKTHVVTELTVTAVDPDNDTVSGTASPETWVSVGVHGVHVERYVRADEHGAWIANFPEAVGPEPWDAAYDLTAGDDGYAQQVDEDGDATSVRWFVADPLLGIDFYNKRIRGEGWPAGAEVVVTLGDPGDPDFYATRHADTWGNWSLTVDMHLHILQAGDFITANAGTYSRSMTVADLSVTGADTVDDTLSGTGPSNAWVLVRVSDVTLEVQADNNGDWTADLATEGIDLQEGTSGHVYFYDESDNYTQIFWRYATLDVMEIELLKFTIPEDHYEFGLFIEVDGLLNARFQAPSEEWYEMVHEWDDWWTFERFADSMDAIDTEFTPGEYLLELNHFHGQTELTLVFPENVVRPNASPIIIAPQARRSDLDPINVLIEWEGVENPTFGAVGIGIEDEFFSDDESGRYEAFLTFNPEQEDMPTQYEFPALHSNRLYFCYVYFGNIDNRQSSGDMTVDYEVVNATLGMTVFSTNTDGDLFDPINRVSINRGCWNEDEYLFTFGIEFSESLQVPGESPLFHRLKLWTPEDEYYTLFDATQQVEFGDLVEFEIAGNHLDALPGSGWHALVVQKDDELAVATWFLFAEPDSKEPLSMPEQIPVVTQPQPDSVLANPLTFVWDSVTDEVVDHVKVFHAPEAYALLATNAVAFSPPEDLPVGPQHVGIAFAGGHRDLSNADSIRYDISQYNATRVDFTVGYTLIYEAGSGGWLEGPVEQVVAPGGSAGPVEAFAEDGAVFQQWDDGYGHAVRTDDEIHADATITAQFSSDGGVSINWYVDHNLAPLEGETWAHLDSKDPHGKGMTLAQEFIALTNPEDTESLFIVEKVSGPPFRIWFNPSSQERMYTLVYTDDLMSEEWHAVDGPRPGMGGDADYLEDEGSETLRFYRVKVELP